MKLMNPNVEEMISIGQIISTLENKPFNVKELKSRELLARFLIEDRKENLIEYNSEA